ncbi:MAG: hypothetical protein R2876_04710 [Eubacteriales bacterium]
MKKIISLIVAILMLVAIFAACGAEEEQPSSSPSDSEETATGPFDDVEPLDEETELDIATVTGIGYGAVVYMIDELGGFEKANIKFDGVGQVYGNGSTLMEAVDSWGVALTGMGGMMTGTISKGCIQTSLTSKDTGAVAFYAQKDSDLANAAISNVGGTKELHGTTADWKDQEIYYPKGTTLHYCLALGLNKLGLDFEDIKSTQMDVPSINTAMRSGTCEVGGLWGSFTFVDDIDDLFVQVMNAKDVDCQLPCAMYWNPTFYKENYDVVLKFTELYFKCVDWIYENEDNARAFVEKWDEWNVDCGVNVPADVTAKYFADPDCSFYTIKEVYDLFNKTVTATDGVEMTGFENMTYEPLKFLISVGSFQEGSLETFLDDKCNGDAVKYIYENIYQGTVDSYADVDWLDDFEY